MKLTFSILWFDDSDDYFGSLDMDALKAEILTWGFSPDIKPVTTPEQFLSYAPFKEFDLIVVDLDLEQYGEGQDFIAGLRANAVYTEVIFYTVRNVNDLWDAVREKQLEGVFVSHRSNILPKIFRVGRQSIRKVLDLENMRGIVMAEVGELDHLIDEILTFGITSLPVEQQNSIFKRFLEKAVEQNQNISVRLAKFSERPDLNEMINLSDSYKRWLNFQRLWKSHEKLKGRNTIGDYDAEVLKPRNFLAHGTPEPHKDGGYLFHYQGKAFRYTDEVSLSLRQTILRYKQEFSNILKTLKS